MALKLKLTDSIFKNLPDSVSRINDTEISGFFARAGKPSLSGRKISFIIRYRVGGRKGIQREYKICNYGDIPLKDVRKLAFQLSAKIASGEDIAATRESERRKAINEHQEIEFNIVLDEFITYCKSHRKDPEPLRMIERDIRPQVGNEKVSHINKRVLVTKVLDPIKQRGSFIQANKTLSILKQALEHAVDRGLLVENCLAGVKRKNIGGSEVPRDRHLKTSELKTIFSKLPQLGLSKQVMYCLKLMLFTGCRVNEICQAKWCHIDLDEMIWTIPPENVKAKKGKEKCHTIPVTDELASFLTIVKASFTEFKSEYILPSVGTFDSIPGLKPLDKRSVARAVNRKTVDLGIEKWTPHDLRRTVQTHLASIGIDAIVIEKILNHELTGMLRVYNKYDYYKERRKALEQWEHFLQKHVF